MIKNLIYSTILFIFIAATLHAQNETKLVYLSGTGYGSTVEWDFFCSDGANNNQWSSINVPSQWEQEGFGAYTYGRWYKVKGERPSNETGHYKTTFVAPEAWKDQNINIVFEGVMTDTKVLINGKQAGDIHQGGFYRFQYDISDKIIFGAENTLEVMVAKQSEDRSINAAERMADWWLFGGIYRPVYLDIRPSTCITQFKVDAKGSGELNVFIEHKNTNKNDLIRCSVIDHQGKIVGTGKLALNAETNKSELNLKVPAIRPWTPETPELYTLKLEIERKGKIIHTLDDKIGFRTIEVRPNDGIYCNGTKIILKGVNRHTFWPESGRCTNKEISILDVNLIKDMNMNAVRSHYPPDEHFFDVCDSLGLFIIDELAGWQNSYSTEIGSKLVKEMVNRDVNHPCVIIWSNGNEGGWNEAIDPMFEALDPQKRDVIHPWADFDDIDAHHYPQYQTGVHRFNNGNKIFMPGEFMHSLYDEGAGAGLDDFWAKWKQSPLFAGGFIWAYADDAIKRTDYPDSLDSNGSNAPDGIVGPHREKEGSFFTIKEIWAPIQFKNVLINSSFKGELFITNEYLYTNLNKCTMSYKVNTIPGPWEKNNNAKTIAQGNIELPSIVPGETRAVKMEMPANFFNGDVLFITATDPMGREIYTWSWPIRMALPYLQRKTDALVEKGKATIQTSGDEVTLSAATTKLTFLKSDGTIKIITSQNTIVPLTNGPLPIGMKALVDKTESRMEGNTAVFTVWYKGGIDSIRWEMHPDGKLKMSMLALNKATNDGGFDGGFVDDKIDLWGLTFSFPEKEVTSIKWFGKGPYRVWKNRQRGTTFNLWEKAYNNTITGESFENLVYPEFKGYHANTYWATLSTKSKVPVTFASESDGLFLRLFTPQEPINSLKRSLPVFPEGDLSFLYEINPIHSFKPVSQMGPQSEPSSIRIKKGDEGISMVLWFNFEK
ncbi:MAG: glycoside hydrolase family 2 TIM barrel-domain containing protein [Prolixibacteraceae bacterium]